MSAEVYIYIYIYICTCVYIHVVYGLAFLFKGILTFVGFFLAKAEEL